MIGSNPAFLSAADLQGLGQPQSPNKAIRAHCVTCSGGSYAEANKCTATGCSLWAFRMGRNPFHASAKQEGRSIKMDNTQMTNQKTAPYMTEVTP